MFVLSPGGGLLNNLYTRRMIKHTFIFHTPIYIPALLSALLKTCSFMEQTQIKRGVVAAAAAAVVESL
jgi:undecaprenyl pyrophosphate phosphatase UppP